MIRGGSVGSPSYARPSEVPWQTLEAGVAAFESGFQLSREQPEQQMRPELAQQS
jgi:hypothetical protein